MKGFEPKFFQRFSFTKEQLDAYLKSSQRDFNIAQESDVAEVVFKFAYDAMLKLAIFLAAKKGYKTRSVPGHHIKLLEKLAEILNQDDIVVVAEEMRQKRNLDLYQGGFYIS